MLRAISECCYHSEKQIINHSGDRNGTPFHPAVEPNATQLPAKCVKHRDTAHWLIRSRFEIRTSQPSEERYLGDSQNLEPGQKIAKREKRVSETNDITLRWATAKEFSDRGHFREGKDNNGYNFDRHSNAD